MSNWRETIERPEMQAMSESYRAWQQQLQQAEMQAQVAAEAPSGWPIELRRPTLEMMDKLEAEAQRADEPALPYEHLARIMAPSDWEKRADEPPVNVYGGGVTTPIDTFRLPSDPPQSEQPATDTSAGAVQQRINDVCQDLVAGRTTPAQQRGLGGAVERAGRIPAGSDAAVGRIARLVR